MVFAEAERLRTLREAIDARCELVDIECKRIIEHVGPKAVGDRLGLDDETQVYHWLSHRGGRRTPYELVDVCLDEDDSNRLIGIVCRDRFTLPERLRRLSPEQEIAALRLALREFGAAGEQKLRAIERARPEQGAETER